MDQQVVNIHGNNQLIYNTGGTGGGGDDRRGGRGRNYHRPHYNVHKQRRVRCQFCQQLGHSKEQCLFWGQIQYQGFMGHAMAHSSNRGGRGGRGRGFGRARGHGPRGRGGFATFNQFQIGASNDQPAQQQQQQILAVQPGETQSALANTPPANSPQLTEAAMTDAPDHQGNQLLIARDRLRAFILEQNWSPEDLRRVLGDDFPQQPPAGEGAKKANDL